jgi:hypothetical protein
MSRRQDVAKADARNGLTCAYGADLRDRLGSGKGYGQDKHETTVGRPRRALRPSPVLAAGSGRQRDCLFSEAVDL